MELTAIPSTLITSDRIRPYIKPLPELVEVKQNSHRDILKLAHLLTYLKIHHQNFEALKLYEKQQCQQQQQNNRHHQI